MYILPVKYKQNSYKKVNIMESESILDFFLSVKYYYQLFFYEFKLPRSYTGFAVPGGRILDLICLYYII